MMGLDDGGFQWWVVWWLLWVVQWLWVVGSAEAMGLVGSLCLIPLPLCDFGGF